MLIRVPLLEGAPGQSTALPRGLTVLGFIVNGLISGLSLAEHSDSGSFLVVCALLSKD